MFELKQLSKRIFLLIFDDGYDLAMHFLRAQEFYESPNKNFRNKQFTLLDYMEWYAKENKGYFSYPDDWSGFNIPGETLNALYYNTIIPDNNKYDEFMRRIVMLIRETVGSADFYLIGCKKGDEHTIDHELAHALWYVGPLEYSEEMGRNIELLSSNEYRLVRESLVNMGYDGFVVADEMQAYFATGLDVDNRQELLENGFKKARITALRKEFGKTFKKYKTLLEKGKLQEQETPKEEKEAPTSDRFEEL